MSPELDVPLTPSADQIRRREFVTVRRGYDPEQVRSYLARVAEQVEALEALARTTRSVATTAPKQEPQAGVQAPPESAAPVAAPAEPAAPSDPYAGLSAHMAELLRTAETTAERIMADAEAERSRILGEAGAEADHIRTDAQGKAEEVRQEADQMSRQAHQEAEQLLAGLDGRRDQLVTELQAMRDRLLSMAQGLGSLAAENEVSLIPEVAVSSGPDPQYAELWDEEHPAPTPPTEAPEDASDAGFDPGTPRFIDPSPPSDEPMASIDVSPRAEVPMASMDPLDRLFADIPTLSLEDLDPGEFDR